MAEAEKTRGDSWRTDSVVNTERTPQTGNAEKDIDDADVSEIRAPHKVCES